jgi:hypothetical protein
MRSSKNVSRGQPPRQRNGKKQQGKLLNELISHPPQIRGIQLTHSATVRFKVITATALAPITFQNLLDTFLVATSAVAGYDVFQAVRIRRVRVWGMPQIGATNSVALEFAGVTAGSTGDQQIHTDTSMGVQPAHVDARPSPRSLASDYQVSSAAVAFNLSVPAGAVVDCELSFRGATYGIATVAAQNALAGANTGSFYVRGLDGLATATTNYTPEFVNGQI